MKSKSLATVIEKTAKELDMPVSVVKEAVYHKYEIFRNAIKHMEYAEILDQYFGRYRVIPSRLKESENYQESAECAEKFINRRKQR